MTALNILSLILALTSVCISFYIYLRGQNLKKLFAKAEEAKLNAMVENMTDGVVMTDTDYKIIVINPSAKKVIGMQEKQDITIFDFIDNLGGKFDIRGRLEESVKLSKSFESEEVLVKDRLYKTFVFPVSSTVGSRKEISGGVVIFHDVTVERSVEQIREHFTSMIVHELRTPLSGIKKISELMHSGKDNVPEKDFNEYVKLINSDSSSMLELVNDILDVSKLEAGKFDVRKEEGDIRGIIDNRVEFFKPTVDDAKVRLGVVYDLELPNTSLFDPSRMKQVLNNLISNAIKFSTTGGSIEIFALNHKAGNKISTEVERLKSKPTVNLPEEKFKNLPNSIIVGVSDTSPGIPEGGIKELFTSFKQLSSSKVQTGQRGSGLGLSIAKGIVEGHGGQIGVVSELGVGSVFFFTIPF
jgi:PAS domain S-box-containing protein